VAALGVLGASFTRSVRAAVAACQQYGAESLVCIGPVDGVEALDDLRHELPAGVRVHVVTEARDELSRGMAERLGMDWHRELVWARYRFVERQDMDSMELYFVSSIGGGTDGASSTYALKVGRAGFGGMRLSTFLKGMGHLILPSMDDGARTVSVLRKSLSRYDVIAVGHSRVFPMGKISEIEPISSFGKVPLKVSSLIKKSKNTATPDTVKPKI
jgi:hypothetical protein